MISVKIMELNTLIDVFSMLLRSLKTHFGLHNTLMTLSSLEIRNFGPYASLTGKRSVRG